MRSIEGISIRISSLDRLPLLRSRGGHRCAQSDTLISLQSGYSLAEAEDGVRNVRFLERGHLFGSEFGGQSGYGIGEVVVFGGADDR